MEENRNWKKSLLNQLCKQRLICSSTCNERKSDIVGKLDIPLGSGFGLQVITDSEGVQGIQLYLGIKTGKMSTKPSFTFEGQVDKVSTQDKK